MCEPGPELLGSPCRVSAHVGGKPTEPSLLKVLIKAFPRQSKIIADAALAPDLDRVEIHLKPFWIPAEHIWHPTGTIWA